MDNILITGANGFIGKSLLDYLTKVINMDENHILLLSSKKRDKYETLVYDKESYLIPSIKDISGIIHLGAFTPKSPNEADNFEYNCGNILYTKNLLQSIPASIKRFVFISTLDVYHSNVPVIDEKSATNPSTLYGWSKLYCEQMVIKWCECHQIAYQILRLGHIYGQGEDAYNKIIPTTIRKIIKNEAPVIFSKGEEKRSFLNVKDCVRMIWQSYSYPFEETIVNLVSKQSISILGIIEIIIQLSGKDLKPEILNQPIAVRNFVFDNQLMRKLFGEEQIELLDGIRDEYNYFLKIVNENSL
jgi:UDP-glucose 4-epimerase